MRDSPAIACGLHRWTYGEFDEVVERVAAGLQGHGVTKGDRVAVLARNSHAFAALRFALARLGAVLVPVNFMLKAEEVAFVLRHADAGQPVAADRKPSDQFVLCTADGLNLVAALACSSTPPISRRFAAADRLLQ